MPVKDSLATVAASLATQLKDIVRQLMSLHFRQCRGKSRHSGAFDPLTDGAKNRLGATAIFVGSLGQIARSRIQVGTPRAVSESLDPMTNLTVLLEQFAPHRAHFLSRQG